MQHRQALIVVVSQVFLNLEVVVLLLNHLLGYYVKHCYWFK